MEKPRPSRMCPGSRMKGLSASLTETNTPPSRGSFVPPANWLLVKARKAGPRAVRLMSLNDGPVLEAMKGLHGAMLREPRREKDRPDQERLAERLAERFERFRAAA
jgi:hypothetical protein